MISKRPFFFTSSTRHCFYRYYCISHDNNIDNVPPHCLHTLVYCSVLLPCYGYELDEPRRVGNQFEADTREMVQNKRSTFEQRHALYGSLFLIRGIWLSISSCKPSFSLEQQCSRNDTGSAPMCRDLFLSCYCLYNSAA